MGRARAGLGSLVFFVVAPFAVAGLVPWLLTRWETASPPWPIAVRVAGAALLLGGAAVLADAFARFVREGLGTPAPVAPTSHLVVGGLYQSVRTPMYLAVAATIVGQSLLLGRPVLLLYAAAVAAVCVAFVRWYEEPALARRFGEEYEAYRRDVPGWLPRRPS